MDIIGPIQQHTIAQSAVALVMGMTMVELLREGIIATHAYTGFNMMLIRLVVVMLLIVLFTGLINKHNDAYRRGRQVCTSCGTVKN